MKLIRPIDKHEMMRRWAIGEVYADLLNDFDPVELGKTLTMLLEKGPETEKQGIKQALKSRHLSLINCIPDNATWYLAALEISKKEFNILNTLPVPDLAIITNNTYRISNGAAIINENKHLNSRITEIMENFRKGKQFVQLSGITLLAQRPEGPFTIIKGNGRLIGLYQVLFNENKKIYFYNNEIEVVLALSDKGIS